MWRRLLSRRLLPLRTSALAALMTVAIIAIPGAQIDAQQPPNRLATGTPTISGTVRVGEFLTAHTSDIADEDGLSNVSFSYGWVIDPPPDPYNVLRNLYSKSSYLVPPDAAGRTIWTAVGFRDDRGTFESVVSAPTAVVAPTVPDPPRNLAVAFGGSGALSVEWEAPVWDLRAWLYGGSTDVGDGGSPITGYIVQWREDTDSWSDPADVSEAVVNTGTTYTIVGLTDGVTYAVRVIAGNQVGSGEPSANAQQPPPNNPATGTPTIIGALRVGEVARVDTSSIADPDGLTDTEFSYTWFADDDLLEEGAFFRAADVYQRVRARAVRRRADNQSAGAFRRRQRQQRIP